MKRKHFLTPRAIANGTSRRQYAVNNDTVNVNTLVNFVAEAAFGNRHIHIKHLSKQLLEMMANRRWFITAGPHAGGFGGNNRGPDQTKHVTVQINGRGSYHLRLDNRNQLFSITGDGVNTDIPAWQAPGT